MYLNRHAFVMNAFRASVIGKDQIRRWSHILQWGTFVFVVIVYSAHSLCRWTEDTFWMARFTWAAFSEKVHSNMRKVRIQIMLRMRKVSCGPLLSNRIYCSIHWFCKRTVKALIWLGLRCLLMPEDRFCMQRAMCYQRHVCVNLTWQISIVVIAIYFTYWSQYFIMLLLEYYA